MLLKQFVNSCFYEKRVIYSNTANSSLVNRKYRIISNVAITIQIARKIKVDNFLQLHVFFVNEVMQKFCCIASNHNPQILKLSRMEWVERFEFPTALSSSLIWTQLNHYSVQSGIKVVVFCDSSCFHLNFNRKQNIIISYIIA